MNTEYFIAKKLIGYKDSKRRISRPIVSISLVSIILGLAVMIITVSIVTGFQNKIREKVIGFGSHLQITNMEDNTSMESSPLKTDSTLLEDLRQNSLVKHVQTYAYKPAILQSQENETILTVAGYSDTVNNKDVLGVLFKGINQTYEMSFFEDKLKDGQLINFESDRPEALISEKIAKLLQYKVGDKISAYFILNNTPKKRTFTITGIYRTGLEEFDKKIIFTNLSVLQDINNWGVKTALTVLDSCVGNQFVVKGLTFGNHKGYRYKWNGVTSSQNYYLIDGSSNNTLIFEATELKPTGDPEQVTWDKSSLTYRVDSACDCSPELLANFPIEYLSDSLIKLPTGDIKIKNSAGTGHDFIGGYEVLIDHWDDLDEIDHIIYSEIPFELKTTKITDIYVEIFAWLNFLDMNIAVVIVMMLVVSLINMITSLLVLIIEKTNFIGILKAIGTTNWSIRKIFIYNALLLLGKGLIWGNVIGISFLLLQNYFNIIPLDPKIYYLDAVPVSFNLVNIISINLLTIATCLLILIIPSYIITKINPIKAIKFD